MKAIFFLFIVLILLGCAEESLIDESLLTQQEDKIVLGDITINNPEKMKYEIIDFEDEGCEEMASLCKLVVFENEEAYMIMKYNIRDSMQYLADFAERSIDDVTDEQLAEANITREEFQKQIDELREI